MLQQLAHFLYVLNHSYLCFNMFITYDICTGPLVFHSCQAHKRLIDMVFIIYRSCNCFPGIHLVIQMCYELTFRKIGFSAMAIQAEIDPTLPYPHINGTFPIALVTIVGEWSHLVDVCFLNILLFVYYC